MVTNFTDPLNELPTGPWPAEICRALALPLVQKREIDPQVSFVLAHLPFPPKI